MEIIAGTAEILSAGMLFDLAHYRYRVFVEKLGWKLETRGRLELDQFDRRDTCYLIARNDEGEMVGTARLLPTDRPYLLATVFPQLLGDLPAPRSPEVWELSRFAALDLGAPPGAHQDPYGSSVALQMLGAAMHIATKAGVQRLISASPLGIERILRRAGVSTHRAAPPVLIDGQSLFACLINVDKTWRPREERPGQIR